MQLQSVHYSLIIAQITWVAPPNGLHCLSFLNSCFPVYYIAEAIEDADETTEADSLEKM